VNASQRDGVGAAGGYAAVIFDFDHTLAHLAVRWDDLRPPLERFYIDAGIPRAFIDEHPGEISLYAAIAASTFLDESALATVQRRASALITSFEAEGIANTQVLADAIVCVRALAARDVRLGVVTSNSSAVVDAILERHQMRGFFASLVGRDDVRTLKPAPEGIEACCGAIGVRPEQTVYVGDTPGDMLAAAAAGARGIGLLTGLGSHEGLVEAGAQQVLVDLSGLERALIVPG
jgi:phosphoglycolate phosphatase